MSRYLIGFDIGSSSVKAALVDVESKQALGSTHYPETEMEVLSLQGGWAEQPPELWWENLCAASRNLLSDHSIRPADVAAIGLSYQMHGLVLVDDGLRVLRPAIIWSDSRAVGIGESAFRELGPEKCLKHLLNSPGNFTLSKLRWVKDHEPDIFARIHKFMLPGDFVAMRMSGSIGTTVPGLSEAIAWDFRNNALAEFVLDHYGIRHSLIPDVVPTFGIHGHLQEDAADALGLAPGTPVTYRAGDQPNNALALNVTEPGEIAATGGTSGVVYAVVDEPVFDPNSRVNGFAHVNHGGDIQRIGVLLCINGAGSQYAWLKRQMGTDGITYDDMEAMISDVPVGSDGLRIIPFGNGAERVLQNQDTGAHMINVRFNKHGRAHMFRAALEGIAFSFMYGMELLKEMQISVQVIRVGNDNLFRSAVFSSTLAALTGCNIEVVKTNGAIGAARGAGVGVGVYKHLADSIPTDTVEQVYTPEVLKGPLQEAYQVWKSDLERLLRNK